jgi:hypothetical protein
LFEKEAVVGIPMNKCPWEVPRPGRASALLNLSISRCWFNFFASILYLPTVLISYKNALSCKIHTWFNLLSTWCFIYFFMYGFVLLLASKLYTHVIFYCSSVAHGWGKTPLLCMEPSISHFLHCSLSVHSYLTRYLDFCEMILEMWYLFVYRSASRWRPQCIPPRNCLMM